MEQTQTKTNNRLTWLWRILTGLIAVTLCTVMRLPSRADVLARADELMKTALDLVLGELSDQFISPAFISWLVVALGYMLVTWFAWLSTENRSDRGYRLKAILRAVIVGMACTIVIVSGYRHTKMPVANLYLAFYAASGVILMMAVLFFFWFCWDRFPKLVNAETVSYVVFGVLTTIVNLVCYNFCAEWLHIDTAWSVSIAWLAGVIFAYVVNKLFVFHSKTHSLGELCKEAGLFFFARFLTYFIDLGGMLLLVDVLHMGGGLSKILCNILVLILNYVFSKLFIFKSGSNPSDDKPAE